jgi:hypothetical protein
MEASVDQLEEQNPETLEILEIIQLAVKVCLDNKQHIENLQFGSSFQLADYIPFLRAFSASRRRDIKAYVDKRDKIS